MVASPSYCQPQTPSILWQGSLDRWLQNVACKGLRVLRRNMRAWLQVLLGCGLGPRWGLGFRFGIPGQTHLEVLNLNPEPSCSGCGHAPLCKSI